MNDPCYERRLTKVDFDNLTDDLLPMMAVSNGYTSAFGYLIGLVAKSFWAHFIWLKSPTEWASQWWWFRTFPIEHYLVAHTVKLWYNPRWTKEERSSLLAAIDKELARPKMETRYDFWGVLGEALGIARMNSKRHDFCSEKVNILSKVDPLCKSWLAETEASPTPGQVDDWLNAQINEDKSRKYFVWGYVLPG